MWRKLNFIIVFLVMISLLAGCSGGNYKITTGKLDSSDSSIRGNYNSFSGTYFKKEKFNKGETVDFKFSVNTVKGKISAKVIDSTGKTIAELGEQETVKIDKTDTYKIEVDANEHQGVFELTWK